MTVNEVQEKIIEEFSAYEDGFKKYEHLVSLGKDLEPLKKEDRTDENLIFGCQSLVWLCAELKDQKIHITADTDALITKGILALLLSVVNNRPPGEILSCDFYFVERIGLSSNLSPARWNGLYSIIKRIKNLAEIL
ncbi:MAG TPA: SufE family protein [Ignavibacteriaceae bacterium]|nr:SufE family protein [Ignavibacteriaceae bacterium]